MKSITKLIIVLVLMPFAAVSGQETTGYHADSLSLNTILNEVIHNYPTIKKAQSDIESSEAKIGLAKTAYLPDVNITASYTRNGPISSMSIPDFGTFQLFPPNNYSTMLNVSESIYDFGKTDINIAFEKQSKQLVESSVEQLKQKLSAMMIDNYYSLVFLQEAIKIKDEELLTLKEHALYVQKKEESGSATNYEILTTKVQISTNENQKEDLINALEIQLSQLNSFLGKPQDSKLKVKNDILTSQILASNDSLFAIAFEHRIEMKTERQKRGLAYTRLDMVKSQNNPSLNLFGSGGIKNGYLPDFNVLTPNYSVGIGLKVPLFDATRSKYSKIMAKADIQGNVQETELVRRNIVTEVVASKVNAESALKKVTLSELQLDQAQQAYNLAETNFKAGAITNLELMYSSTAVTNSKLALLKSRIEYSASVLKLRLALGEHIY